MCDLLTSPEVLDSNQGVTRSEVAPRNDSARDMARAGSDSGVSTDPVQHALRYGGDKTLPMPTLDAVYAFLHEHYLHSRFAGRDGEVWGRDYSRCVAQSTLDSLQRNGVACVGMYESASGRAVWFDRELRVLNPDEPRAQIQARAPNLTHIYGGGW